MYVSRVFTNKSRTLGYGAKVGPGPWDAGTQYSGPLSKFKSGTWDPLKFKNGTPAPSKFKNGTPGPPLKFKSRTP